jgi:hypothetical protein
VLVGRAVFLLILLCVIDVGNKVFAKTIDTTNHPTPKQLQHQEQPQPEPFEDFKNHRFIFAGESFERPR